MTSLVIPARTPAPCCAPLDAGALSQADAEGLATRLKALADPTRLRLLSMLLAADGGEACTCDLVEPLGLSQPTISHHLKTLAESGIVEGEKRGRWTWYRVDPDAISALQDVLTVSPTPSTGTSRSSC